MSTPNLELRSWPALAALVAAGLLAGASVLTNVSAAVAKHHDVAGKIVAGSIAGAVALLVAVALPAAVRSFGRREYVAGTAALVAFGLAAAFSVSSALGVLGGARLQAALSGQHTESERARLTSERRKANDELATIALARSIGELTPEIARILAVPGVNGCTVLDGPITRQWCPLLAGLQSELARTQRTAALHGTVARIDKDLARLGAPKIANADAATLAHVLKAVGLRVSPERLDVALIVLGVVLLETGGGLAMTVAQLLSDRQLPTLEAVIVAESAPPQVEVTAPAAPAAPAAHAVPTAPVDRDVKLPARDRLIALLRDNGGTFSSSQRELAKRLDVSPGRVAQVVAALRDEGAITAKSTAAGTVLRLVPARVIA